MYNKYFLIFLRLKVYNFQKVSLFQLCNNTKKFHLISIRPTIDCKQITQQVSNKRYFAFYIYFYD